MVKIIDFIHDDGRKEVVGWGYIAYKTSKGSIDAHETLSFALEAVVALKKGLPSGWNWEENELRAILKERITTEQPAPTLQDFLDTLFAQEILTKPIQTTGQPFHPYDKYTHLWDSGWQADPDELTHDAALGCFHHWSVETFFQKLSSLSFFDYNSQDMLFIWLFIAYLYF